jgi:hypothetical protein
VGSPQYPSPLRYSAIQQSQSRCSRTIGCYALHHSIRIWLTIVFNSITGLKAIRGCSRILGFRRVRPTKSIIPLIITCERLLLGPTSKFVCRLRVRPVSGLALHRLTIPLPLLDCPMSGLWPRRAIEPSAVVSDQFVFVSVARAAPLPRLPLVLLLHPPYPHN